METAGGASNPSFTDDNNINNNNINNNNINNNNNNINNNNINNNNNNNSSNIINDSNNNNVEKTSDGCESNPVQDDDLDLKNNNINNSINNINVEVDDNNKSNNISNSNGSINNNKSIDSSSNNNSINNSNDINISNNNNDSNNHFIQKDSEKSLNDNVEENDIKDTDNKNSDDNTSDNSEDTILFDDIMNIIGQFGPYQLLIFLTFNIGMIIEVLLVMTYVFVGAMPNDYYCNIPTINHLNLSEELKKNITIETSSQCAMYDRDYTNWTLDTVEIWRTDPQQFSNQTVPCRFGWIYDRGVYEETIVTQWDLVCDDVWKSSFVYSAVAIGQLIGAVVWGFLLDRFGRKWPYIYAIIAMILFAEGASFSPSYLVYCLLQFFMGLHTVVTYSIGATVAVEITGIRVRGHLSTAVNYFWSLGYMLLPLIAYFVRTWQKLQLYICIGAAVSVIFLVFIKESPRWLYAHDKRKQADAILKRIARCNGKTFPEQTRVVVIGDDISNRGSVLDLCRSCMICGMTSILYFLWFSNSLVYFGISLYLPTLSDNPYLNFFISGAIEIPGYAIAQLSIAYLGRKRPLSVVMVFAGMCLYVLLIIENKDINWLSITLALIGKMCVTASWSIAICFSNELYPTMIRGRGLLFCTLFGNLGNVLAPQVNLLGQVVSPVIPPVVFATLSVLSGIICHLLPETKDAPLYDTVDEMRENVSIKNIFKCKSCSKSPYQPELFDS